MIVNRHAVTCLIFLILSVICVQENHAADNLAYLEQTPLTLIEVNWQIEKRGDSLFLSVTKSTGETYTSQHDERGAVLEWKLKDPETDTDITARRQENVILIEGVSKGERIDKSVAIDSAPWYQTVSFSLTRFIGSKEPSTTFWALKTDTLTPYKMRAFKREHERIVVQDKEIEAQKVRVKLTGFKAVFWHSDYWLRKTDGLFLLYEGVEGPPGTPQTIITLTSPVSEE